jgi:intracellular multiplication protein IcmD
MRFLNRFLSRVSTRVLSLLPKFILAGVLFAIAANADASTYVTLSNIASNVGKSVSSLAIILQDLALIAGIGFIMASFFKFHQHKLNPTQVPMSQGITLLLIGAGLTLFPVLLPTAGTAIVGSKATFATIGGSGVSGLVSGGS